MSRGQLLFRDDFNTIDTSRWEVTQGAFRAKDGILEAVELRQDFGQQAVLQRLGHTALLAEEARVHLRQAFGVFPTAHESLGQQRRRERDHQADSADDPGNFHLTRRCGGDAHVLPLASPDHCADPPSAVAAEKLDTNRGIGPARKELRGNLAAAIGQVGLAGNNDLRAVNRRAAGGHRAYDRGVIDLAALNGQRQQQREGARTHPTRV